jgi:hypothetical protein
MMFELLVATLKVSSKADGRKPLDIRLAPARIESKNKPSAIF